MSKFAFYPGCYSEGFAKENEVSTRLICSKLDIELVDLDFSCCGAGNLNEVNPSVNLLTNARNFALAEKQGLDIVTICSTCLNVMRKAQRELQDKSKFEHINSQLQKIGLHYSGKVKIVHLLWALDLKKIKSSLVKELKGIKVAAYYGCHALRPKEEGADDPYNPTTFEKLIKTLKGTPVDFPKTKCCGFHTALTYPKTSIAMTQEIINEIDADLICVICPFCHTMMDAYQKTNLPALHLSQLIGLCLGFSKKELMIDRNLIDFKRKLD